MKRLSLVLLIALLCATCTLAQEPQERIAYYTVKGSKVTIYFLDPATRTTTQHSFDLLEGEDIRSISAKEDQVVFALTGPSDTASRYHTRIWTPSTNTLTNFDWDPEELVPSPDGRFVLSYGFDFDEKTLTITIQNTATDTQRFLAVPAEFPNQIVWAHHSNLFAIFSLQCTKEVCEDARLLIIDAQTGTVKQRFSLLQVSSRDLSGVCHFVWSPDDQAVAFLHNCYNNGLPSIPQVYVQTLTSDPRLLSVKLGNNHVPMTVFSLISDVSTTWLDTTHLIIGSAGRLTIPEWFPSFDATEAHTYLYDIETKDLTPFLDQYTTNWTEIQPGIFSYNAYSFSTLNPQDIESRVQHINIARFDGTTLTVISSTPANTVFNVGANTIFNVGANEAGTWLAYAQGYGSIIRVVSVEEGTSYTYVPPQGEAYYIGWVTIDP